MQHLKSRRFRARRVTENLGPHFVSGQLALECVLDFSAMLRGDRPPLISRLLRDACDPSQGRTAPGQFVRPLQGLFSRVHRIK